MSVEAEFRALLLRLGPELVAHVREELARPKLIPIKETPISYRAILAAEKRGELQIFRIGHAALVDEQDLFQWVRRTGTKRDEPETIEQPDELGDLIAMNDRRRRRRSA